MNTITLLSATLSSTTPITINTTIISIGLFSIGVVLLLLAFISYQRRKRAWIYNRRRALSQLIPVAPYSTKIHSLNQVISRSCLEDLEKIDGITIHDGFVAFKSLEDKEIAINRYSI